MSGEGNEVFNPPARRNSTPARRTLLAAGPPSPRRYRPLLATPPRPASTGGWRASRGAPRGRSRPCTTAAAESANPPSRPRPSGTSSSARPSWSWTHRPAPGRRTPWRGSPGVRPRPGRGRPFTRLALQPVQGREERPRLHDERPPGHLADPLGDGHAMEEGQAPRVRRMRRSRSPLAESRTAELLYEVCDVDLDALDLELAPGFGRN